MAGTIYPIGIDGFAQLPIVIDGSSPVRAQDVNLIRDAIVAVEKELGINPSGTYSTVRARLDALDSLVALLPDTGPGEGTSILLDFLSLALEAPIDKTYNLVTNIPYDGYMFSIATIASSGTATGTTLINGVPLGGGPNSISTTQEVVFHSVDRTFVPGDDIQFEISGNAGAQDVVATMVFLRFVQVIAVEGSGGDGYVQSSTAPSVDNAVIRYDGTTGQVIQESGVIIDDSSNMIGVNTLAVNVAGSPNSTLQVDGSIALGVRTVAATGPLTIADNIILVDASGGDVDVTLPLASGTSGRSYNIKRVDNTSNIVRVLRSGADTIDGAINKPLAIQYEAYQFVSDGSGWFIF